MLVCLFGTLRGAKLQADLKVGLYRRLVLFEELKLQADLKVGLYRRLVLFEEFKPQADLKIGLYRRPDKQEDLCAV